MVRIKNFFRGFNASITDIHAGAYILFGMTFVSLFLSILRDKSLAHFIGAGELLDVYNISFRIPDLFLVFIVSITSVFALLPMFEQKKLVSEKELSRFTNTVFAIFCLLILFGTIALFVFTPAFIHTLYPTMNPQSTGLTILFTRALIIQVLFLGFSNFISSLLQLHKKFIMFALSPIMYNIGIILGVVIGYPYFGPNGLIGGVVVGAFLHLIIQLPSIIHSKLSVYPRMHKEQLRDVYITMLVSLPRALALSSGQIISFANSVFLTPVMVGAYSVYTFADNIRTAPLTLIGVSYSITAFPILSSLFAKKDTKAFADETTNTICHILFLSFPLITLLILLRDPIVHVLLTSGLYTAATSKLTVAVMAILALATIGNAITLLGVRVFYAARKTLMPVSIFVASAVVKVFVLWAITSSKTIRLDPQSFIVSAFSIPNRKALTLIDVSLWYVIIEVVFALLMLYALKVYFKINLKKISTSTSQHLLASLCMTGALLVFNRYAPFPKGDWYYYWIHIAVASSVAFIVWLSLLSFVKNKELSVWQNFFRARLQKVRNAKIAKQ